MQTSLQSIYSLNFNDERLNPATKSSTGLKLVYIGKRHTDLEDTCLQLMSSLSSSNDQLSSAVENRQTLSDLEEKVALLKSANAPSIRALCDHRIGMPEGEFLQWFFAASVSSVASGFEKTCDRDTFPNRFVNELKFETDQNPYRVVINCYRDLAADTHILSLPFSWQDAQTIREAFLERVHPVLVAGYQSEKRKTPEASQHNWVLSRLEGLKNDLFKVALSPALTSTFAQLHHRDINWTPLLHQEDGFVLAEALANLTGHPKWEELKQSPFVASLIAGGISDFAHYAHVLGVDGFISLSEWSDSVNGTIWDLRFTAEPSEDIPQRAQALKRLCDLGLIEKQTIASGGLSRMPSNMHDLMREVINLSDSELHLHPVADLLAKLNKGKKISERDVTHVIQSIRLGDPKLGKALYLQREASLENAETIDPTPVRPNSTLTPTLIALTEKVGMDGVRQTAYHFSGNRAAELEENWISKHRRGVAPVRGIVEFEKLLGGEEAFLEAFKRNPSTALFAIYVLSNKQERDCVFAMVDQWGARFPQIRDLARLDPALFIQSALLHQNAIRPGLSRDELAGFGLGDPQDLVSRRISNIYCGVIEHCALHGVLGILKTFPELADAFHVGHHHDHYHNEVPKELYQQRMSGFQSNEVPKKGDWYVRFEDQCPYRPDTTLTNPVVVRLDPFKIFGASQASQVDHSLTEAVRSRPSVTLVSPNRFERDTFLSILGDLQEAGFRAIIAPRDNFENDFVKKMIANRWPRLKVKGETSLTSDTKSSADVIIVKRQGVIIPIQRGSVLSVIGADKNTCEAFGDGCRIIQFDGSSPNNYTFNKFLADRGYVEKCSVDTESLLQSIINSLSRGPLLVDPGKEYFDAYAPQYKKLMQLFWTPFLLTQGPFEP